MMIKMTIINEHTGIRQFFTRQNFPNPDSSIFSTIKILCHMVYIKLKAISPSAFFTLIAQQLLY